SDRRSGRRALLAREPDVVRDPRLDVADRRPDGADIRAHRHRPGYEDDVGGDPDPRPAVSDSVGTPGRARLPEDDRQTWHPGLDPDRAEVHVSPDLGLGRAALASRRQHRAEPGLVGVGQGVPWRQGPPRLHPEHVHQDPGRAVLGAAGGRSRGLAHDYLGRARRPGAGQRPLDDPNRGGTGRPARGSLRERADGSAGAAVPLRGLPTDPPPQALGLWLAPIAVRTVSFGGEGMINVDERVAAPVAAYPEASGYPRRGELRIVEVPARRCLAVDGVGEPGGRAFQDAIGALYGTAYSLHFLLRERGVEAHVSPLEGLWTRREG